MLKSGIYNQLAPVLFGSGTMEQTGEIAKNMNMSHVMIVTDSNEDLVSYADTLKNILENNKIASIIWSGVETDAPDGTIRAAAAIAREHKVNGIIGVGGGSTLDSAKAIAVVAVNGDEVLHEIPLYLTGQKQYAQKTMPMILLPTTSGTGSESTFVSVISSSVFNCKIGLPCPPDYAIVDPKLTLSAPAYITAFTGMDAFAHANEALTEKKSNPHVELLAYEAIRLIAKWLPTAVKDGSNLEARENLALASNFAGIAFNESGVHIGHSTAHALGHMYHIPHGVCCALATPEVIAFAAKSHPEKIKRIGEAMGMEISTENAVEIGKMVAGKVRELLKEIELPSLKEQGFTKEQILAAKPMIYGEVLCMTFDGEVTEQDVETLLENMYDNYTDD